MLGARRTAILFGPYFIWIRAKTPNADRYHWNVLPIFILRPIDVSPTAATSSPAPTFVPGLVDGTCLRNHFQCCDEIEPLVNWLALGSRIVVGMNARIVALDVQVLDLDRLHSAQLRGSQSVVPVDDAVATRPDANHDRTLLRGTLDHRLDLAGINPVLDGG